MWGRLNDVACKYLLILEQVQYFLHLLFENIMMVNYETVYQIYKLLGGNDVLAGTDSDLEILFGWWLMCRVAH